MRLRNLAGSALAVATTALAIAGPAGAWTTNQAYIDDIGSSTTVIVQVRSSHSSLNVPMNCSGMEVEGFLNRGTSSTPFAAAAMRINFGAAVLAGGRCSIGINTATVSCSSATFNALSYASQVTSGNLSGISCSISAASCTVTMSSTGTGGHGVDVTYTNTAGGFTIRGDYPSTQTLTASWSNTTACNNIFNTGTVGDPHSGSAYVGIPTQNIPGYPNTISLLAGFTFPLGNITNP
jgi:hypothetical protein